LGVTGVWDRLVDEALHIIHQIKKIIPLKEKKKQLSLLSADKAIAVTEQLKQ